MSYDLMVFRPDAAPRERAEFVNWYYEQTKWSEGHSYDDPAVTADNLKNWFADMITVFPAMNGPYAKGEDDDFVTDYSIGKDVIYAAFSWSLSRQAYEKMKALAEKHQVGFYDCSGDDEDILFPDERANNFPAPGQEEPIAVEEAPSANPADVTDTGSWWKRIFGLRFRLRLRRGAKGAG